MIERRVHTNTRVLYSYEEKHDTSYKGAWAAEKTSMHQEHMREFKSRLEAARKKGRLARITKTTITTTTVAEVALVESTEDNDGQRERDTDGRRSQAADG